MEVVNMIQHQNYINKQETTTISPPQTTTSPPSASASPTHEFSFTISLNPNPPSKSTQQISYTNNPHIYDNNIINDNHHHNRSLTPPQEQQPLTAIDLSPADDIFFHGHLLPLHLLSHLPISPRSSTNSMDSFTLPMKDILKDQNNPIGNTSFHYHHRNTFSDFNLPNNHIVNQTRPKSKSFSIFGRPKWKKGSLDHEKELGEDHNKETIHNSKKKLKQEVAQLIKRYMKMVRPFMSFTKAKRPNNTRQQPHSFSGNLMSMRSSSQLPAVEMNRGGRKRGKFSAPASMRTSPTNSGILLASGTVSPAISTTSDSTMEELQAAIQAAIAHCKNSIAIEDHKVEA
ncbi:hypothetical protein QVD17_10421 [Tagetes erecta]|uniref:BRI1 kinase inhibitor 1 n=1 Tax=Tagetes erecta TaxID=13708 RepID=A0AAD8L995_TARER|nr:hypothetical protein QVD17_10421 [Tagetes erecta]